MKQLLRFLSVLVSMALLMSSVPVSVLAEMAPDAGELVIEQAMPEEEPVGESMETPAEQEEELVSMEILPPETEEIPAAEENDLPSEEAEPESETELQEMSFAGVIASLNAGEGPQAPFTVADITLAAGTDYDLYAEGVLPAPADGDTYSFSTTDMLTAYVDENGVLHAAFSGEATIGLSVNGGEEARLLVKVSAQERPAFAVTLERETIGVRMQTKVTATHAVRYDYSGDVIQLDPDGTITGLKPGEASITLTSVDTGETASATIIVLPAAESRQVTIAATEVNLRAGEQLSLDAKCADGTISEFGYESLNSAIAEVDEKGNITAIAPGTAEIIVADKHNFLTELARCTVHVVEPAYAISLSEESLVIGKGDSFDLKQLIRLPEDTIAEFTYSTSAKKYVTVSADGVVKGAAKGSATVTVKTENGLSAKIKVTVRSLANASRMSLNDDELILGVGMTAEARLKFASGYGGLYEFVSSNASAAAVDASTGAITAIEPGEATITARLIQKPDAAVSMRVKVLPAPQSISASADFLQLGLGQVSNALKGACPSGSMCAFTYNSENDDIVQVDLHTGEITAVGKGRTDIVIYASNNPGAYVICPVEVVDAPYAISLSESALTIGKGDTFDLKPLVQLSEGSAASLSYSTSAKKNVTVTEDGVIKGVKKGSATITVKAHNGVSAAIKVTVGNLAGAGRIKFSPSSLEVGVNSTAKLAVKFTSGYGGLYRLTSSDPSIVQVDDRGNVTGVKPGSAKITATLIQKDSVSKSVDVVVRSAPEKIEASRASLTLAVGQQSSALQGVNPDPANSACGFIYESLNPDVVQADPASGRLTAVGVGRAEIIITADNNPAATVRSVITVVSMNIAAMTIGVGDVCDLKAQILHPDGDAAGEYSFSTSAKKTVSVSADGVIKGLKKGSANITVKNEDGLNVKFKVTVRGYASAGKIRFVADALTLGEGMTGKLEVEFTSGYAGLYTLASSRSDVALVDENGLVTALAPGETVITATLTKNPAITASAHVKVLPAPRSISASATELILGAGEKSAALYGVCPEDSLCAFSYASDAPSVARVDALTGSITALGTGTARITITPMSGSAAPAVCTVQVRPAPAALTLKESSLTIGKGDTLDLKQLIETNPGSAASFSYSTSAKKKVTVSADGVVKGVKKGSATITVKTQNGLSAKIKINVKTLAGASRITLSPASLTLGVGMSAEAQVKFTSGYGGVVNFASSNRDAVIVDENGCITAVGEGNAEITATLAQNSAVQKRMQVQVKPAPQSISASAASLTLGVGQVSDALQGVCPAGSMCGFTYSSDNDAVARVDASTGEITAVGRGSAVITITASNNPAATAQCSVEVLKAPYCVSVLESSLTIGKGDSYDLSRLVHLPAGSAASLSYSTSAKKYVTVSADGEIKGAATGSATITVKAHNGLSAKIKVTVKAAPKALRLQSDVLTLGEGMRSQLKFFFEPASSYSVVTFHSSAEQVARVDADGWITALSVGETTITAETLNGKLAAMTLKVVPGTTSIEFAQETYSLSEEMELPTAILTDSGSLDSYIYASSDPSVVEIDENGVLKGMGKGTATITVATAKGVKSTKTCTVTVTPVPYVLDFNGMPDMVIAKGVPAAMPEPYAVDKAGDLVPAEFTYAFTKSEYSRIAKIEGSEITGLAAGEVVVRVKSHNGKSIDFTVQVINDTITGVELAHNSYTLYIREGSSDSVELKGRVMGSKVSFGAPVYESSHPEIASVDANGVVTAVAPGIATITAQAYTGITASCEITVGTLTGSISFASAEAAVTEGKTLQLAPVFDPGTGARVQYESSDAAVAVVDADGLITGITPGSAVITAVTQNGLSAQVNLKVRAVPAAIYLAASGLNLTAGENVTLKPEVLKAANLAPEADVDDAVSYSSSAPGVAKVDANGTVTAVSAGTAVITVETCNGLTAACTVKVLSKGSAKTEFSFKTATMIKGDTAALQFNLSKDAYERGFSLQSSDPAALQVDMQNWTIKALAAAPEGVTLSLQVNPPEGENPAEGDAVTAVVKILEKSEASFSAEEIALRRGETASLKVENLPEDLIGTFEILVEDEAVAVYDAKTGIVQAMDLVADTRVICRLYDREISCPVRVLPTYRALIISEFNKSKDGALPFAQSNVDAMYETLYMSLIDGQTYATNVLSSNPTQAQIASAISSAFAGAREGDVSLVYIVSHGYYNKDKIEGYCFGTPGWSAKKPDTYITSEELYGWLDAIPGNVILMLDSCKSGGFIRDTKSLLEADGSIAVITAQTYNKNASYFVKGDGSSVEFLTYALCAGFGYDYENGVPTGDLKADANGDGEVTISECFKYTKSATTSLVKSKAASYFKAGSSTGFLVPGVKTNSQLKSWGGQTPQTFIPSSMEDIVIYSE